MARKPRRQFPGALYHVMSRGSLKQKIFLDNGDRLNFTEKLSEVVASYEWSCYAYCLIGNHFHLLLETPQANISSGMHMLNSDYCDYFKRKYDSVGHVLQGRYRSPLVDNEAYLMAIIRYIAINPVEAGLVSEQGQWRWSSYRAISGLDPAPDFLDVNYTLNLFSDDIEVARKAYIRFVSEGPLLERLTDQMGRLTLQELFQGAWNKHLRNMAIHIAHFKYDYTINEIAAYLKLCRTTVSRELKG
jgi:REP element-mobilizing transposase RayT